MSSFKFIDLFAGIGGIRIAFDKIGEHCVFTSEINEWSKKTYLANFGAGEQFIGDIVPFNADEIPNHDVLLAGFPCQPFSIAGVTKKMRSDSRMVSSVQLKAHSFSTLPESLKLNVPKLFCLKMLKILFHTTKDIPLK